jgi:hypothetical protein
MQTHFPRGGRLSALEKNELKRRALEMVLLLFYVEDLKNFVVSSIQASDNISDAHSGQHRLPTGTKGLYQAAWKILVGEGVLTSEESIELQRLIDYRNLIAHQTQNLMADIGRYPSIRAEGTQSQYNFDALQRIRHLRQKLFSGMRQHFILSLSYRGLLFEAAERTYTEELKRLELKIRRQAAANKHEVDEANATIDMLRRSALLDKLQPGHPNQVGRNRKFTSEGINCCKQLFEAGASPFVVAHLMRCSLRAATRQHGVWQANLSP